MVVSLFGGDLVVSYTTPSFNSALMPAVEYAASAQIIETWTCGPVANISVALG